MSEDDSPVAAFYVDVNSASDSGKVGTTREAGLRRYSDPEKAEVGSYVWAIDADDNACTALVTAADGNWLELHMDESTWKPFAYRREQDSFGRDDRISLVPLGPEQALRALLQTSPHD